MQNNHLDNPPSKKQLFALADAGLLSPKALERSLALSGVHPDGEDWRRFADRMLMILGAVLTVSGIFFFFAYNWQDMGHFLKLGMIQAIFFGLIVFVSMRGLDKLSGKIALTVACFMVGALFAVYGQVYQTGADSYRFFFTWGLLILGFAFIGRFTTIWFLFYVLMNLSLFFYNEQILNIEYEMVPYLFLWLNGVAMIVWEFAYLLNNGWMKNRWMGRVISLPFFWALLLPTWWAIFDYSYGLSDAQLNLIRFTPLLFFAITGFTLYLYSQKIHDLFVLAVASFSVVSVIMAYLFEVVDWDAWFLLGMVLVGLTAAAVNWLRYISSSWEVQHETG